MATVQGVTVATERGIVQTTWTGFAASGDVGTPEQLGRYPIKGVQVTGTFANSMSVTLEGSEDGVTYFALLSEANTDPVIAFLANGRADVVGNPRFIRPRATAGSASSVTVVLTSKVFGN